MAEAVTAQISSVAAAANVADKVVRKYTHALSGFVVSGPTPNQLRALVDDPNVVAIWPNRIYRAVSVLLGKRVTHWQCQQMLCVQKTFSCVCGRGEVGGQTIAAMGTGEGKHQGSRQCVLGVR
jgi:hypothetical protein